MKGFLHTLMGAASGAALLILTSFVPSLFSEVMALVEAGAEVNAAAWAVFFWLAILGGAMFVFGHIFNAFNKKVAKHFETWFE
ncbi:hypothetical protein [Stutzerimonas balearica]|uniref:hypothetical protein n=1 Tax=Stutzerimonas balearica TaxID=74829 RepID=UPI00115FB9A6|nr:hypothetical protein [Stutzerimonas balearica]